MHSRAGRISKHSNSSAKHQGDATLENYSFRRIKDCSYRSSRLNAASITTPHTHIHKPQNRANSYVKLERCIVAITRRNAICSALVKVLNCLYTSPAFVSANATTEPKRRRGQARSCTASQSHRMSPTGDKHYLQREDGTKSNNDNVSKQTACFSGVPSALPSNPTRGGNRLFATPTAARALGSVVPNDVGGRCLCKFYKCATRAPDFVSLASTAVAVVVTIEELMHLFRHLFISLLVSFDSM